jgi:hypothetical protein
MAENLFFFFPLPLASYSRLTIKYKKFLYKCFSLLRRGGWFHGTSRQLFVDRMIGSSIFKIKNTQLLHTISFRFSLSYNDKGFYPRTFGHTRLFVYRMVIAILYCKSLKKCMSLLSDVLERGKRDLFEFVNFISSLKIKRIQNK